MCRLNNQVYVSSNDRFRRFTCKKALADGTKCFQGKLCHIQTPIMLAYVREENIFPNDRSKALVLIFDCCLILC